MKNAPLPCAKLMIKSRQPMGRGISGKPVAVKIKTATSVHVPFGCLLNALHGTFAMSSGHCCTKCVWRARFVCHSYWKYRDECDYD